MVSHELLFTKSLYCAVLGFGAPAPRFWLGHITIMAGGCSKGGFGVLLKAYQIASILLGRRLGVQCPFPR